MLNLKNYINYVSILRCAKYVRIDLAQNKLTVKCQKEDFFKLIKLLIYINLFIYFTFGCVGSLLLRMGFL